MRGGGNLVVINARVYTFNSRRMMAEAVVIEDGRIVYVGSSESARRAAGRGSDVVDARGKAVTPGLIDTHAHMAMWGIYSTLYLDLSYPLVDSIAKMIQVVSKKAAEIPEGEWIVGRGWNHSLYPEVRPPNRWDLDAAAPRNPVILWHASGHMVVVNSEALRISGIDERTQDPPGGVIQRNERGVPTGLLAEKPAIDLVARHLPRISRDQWERGIEHAMRVWASEGVTAVKDPTVSGASSEVIEAYAALWRRGLLSLRVSALYWAQSLEELSRGRGVLSIAGDPFFKVQGVKIILDGALSTRTAWISRDYRGAPGVRGLPTLDLSEFREMVVAAHDMGYQLSVHAIGDMAIEEVVRSYEISFSKTPGVRRRHTVIHFMLPREDHVERLAKLGGAAEVQAGFLYFLAEAYRRNLDDEALHRLLPLRTMISKGLTVCNGSDSPVIPYPPRYGIYAAVARRSREGLLIGPSEAISVEQALATYTSEASKCIEMEDLVGVLEPGRLGDLVVWDRDPMSLESLSEILDMKPLHTIVEGRIVYPRD